MRIGYLSIIRQGFEIQNKVRHCGLQVWRPEWTRFCAKSRWWRRPLKTDCLPLFGRFKALSSLSPRAENQFTSIVRWFDETSLQEGFDMDTWIGYMSIRISGPASYLSLLPFPPPYTASRMGREPHISSAFPAHHLMRPQGLEGGARARYRLE